MEEEAEDQELKSQLLIPKSYTRYHLPAEIIHKLDKSVKSEVSKLGDSRSIMHLTLERLKDQAINFFMRNERFIHNAKSPSYVQVKFGAYFVHDKPYITDLVSGAKPKFYDKVYRPKKYFMQSLDHLPRIISQQNKIILQQMIDFEMNGSDWLYVSHISYQIQLIRFDTIFTNAKGFIPTPEWLNRRRAVINIQNKDDKGFIKCIYRYFNRDKHRHDYRDIPDSQLNQWIQERGLDLSMLKHYTPGEITLFEEKNRIGINIFSLGPNSHEETQLRYTSIFNDNDRVDVINLGYLSSTDDNLDIIRLNSI
jgi:hypothetical protein